MALSVHATNVNRVLDQIKELATNIEQGDFYFGPLDTKCQLIRALADTIRQEDES